MHVILTYFGLGALLAAGFLIYTSGNRDLREDFNTFTILSIAAMIFLFYPYMVFRFVNDRRSGL